MTTDIFAEVLPPLCKSYRVVITPSARYITGAISVCLQSIAPSYQSYTGSSLGPPIPKPTVSPNPTQGHFVLTLEKPYVNNIDIELFDSMGRVILHQQLSKGQQHLALNQTKDLATGVYFLRMTSEDIALEPIKIVVE